MIRLAHQFAPSNTTTDKPFGGMVKVAPPLTVPAVGVRVTTPVPKFDRNAVNGGTIAELSDTATPAALLSSTSLPVSEA